MGGGTALKMPCARSCCSNAASVRQIGLGVKHSSSLARKRRCSSGDKAWASARTLSNVLWGISCSFCEAVSPRVAWPRDTQWPRHEVRERRGLPADGAAPSIHMPMTIEGETQACNNRYRYNLRFLTSYTYAKQPRESGRCSRRLQWSTHCKWYAIDAVKAFISALLTRAQHEERQKLLMDMERISATYFAGVASPEETASARKLYAVLVHDLRHKDGTPPASPGSL